MTEPLEVPPLPAKKKSITGRGSKNKGSNYEREVAEFFNSYLYPNASIPRIHRTPLSGSFSLHKGSGSADLTGTDFIWVEAKRTEKLNVRAALSQAKRGTTAAGNVDMPVVITRQNKMTTGQSLVVLELSDFIKLYRSHLIQQGVPLGG